MADASVYAQYQGSKGIKSGGVWEDGAFTNEDWRPTWRRYKGLVRQAKPMYQNYFDKDDEATAMAQMKAFIKANLTGLSRGPDDNYVDNIQNIDELYAILGQASHDAYNLAYKTQDGYDEPHSAFTEPLKRALGEYSNFLNLVTELENKKLNTKQINQFLSSKKVQGKDSSTLAELANNIDGFSTSEIAAYGVQNDPDDPESYQMTDADVAVGSADTVSDTVSEQIDSAVVGDSSLAAVKQYAEDNDNVRFVEENGKYYLEDLDENGNPVADSRQELAVDPNNDQIVYVGGDNNGDRWTAPGDGMASTYADMTDVERETFDKIQEVTGDYEQFVTDTQAAIDADENDFAGQINAQLNQFLTGKDADGNPILDPEGNRIKGFLDYQSDLQAAGETLKTDMQGLQGMYDQTYDAYSQELDPLRNKMSTITGQAMDVARDAGDENYYGRLKDLYYQDAKEQVDRDAQGARDTLTSTYANAGLDPSSPAFTAAMTDLAKSRSDSLRSSRRQAILDSYGLGSQMLTNRSNALNTASGAVGAEMNAVDSLYGVKLAGLNNRKDMIGQIYGAARDVAGTGVTGLNTILDANLKGIQANQTQFNKNIDLNNSLYSNLLNVYGGLRNTASTEADDAFNTLTEYDMGQGSNKLTLETLRQYASENPNYNIDPDLEKFLLGGN
jgi:hypothetical protein